MAKRSKSYYICVTRDAVDRESGRRVTGVFEWGGTSWRTHYLVRLIKELPSSISDKDLRAEYKKAVAEMNEVAS